MAKDKRFVTVLLSDGAKAKLDALCELHGMTQKALLGRLIDWFVCQDQATRAIVLGQVDGEALVASLGTVTEFYMKSLPELTGLLLELKTQIDEMEQRRRRRGKADEPPK